MKLLLYGYDDYLFTDKNVYRFIETLHELNINVTVTKVEDHLYIDFGSQNVPEYVFNCCEDFWEADPERTVIWHNPVDHQAVAVALYEIIDDIDTIGDIAGGNNLLYRQLVQNRIKDRFEFCSSDGVSVGFQTPRSD